MKDFANDIERSFWIDWQLNGPTSEKHRINSAGEGEGEDGQDEEGNAPRRSMSVYSVLVLDEIAGQPPSPTSASGSDEENSNPAEGRARRPVLKLDTVTAALYASIDLDFTLIWSDEESSDTVSLYVSPIDQSPIVLDEATDGKASNDAEFREVWWKCASLQPRDDISSLTALPALLLQREVINFAL